MNAGSVPAARMATVPASPARARVHRAGSSLSTSPQARATAPGAGIASQNAPSIGLPLRFVVFGLLSLFVGAGFLLMRPDLLANYHYGSQVLAVTHIFTLGFIASIVMGAMYQLVPVALETKLHSERMGKWQFAAHALGLPGMVWMFWLFDLKQVGHFGSLVALSIGLFVYNMARTLARIPRWNVIAYSIASALGWLTLTMLAGLYVAAAKCWTFSPFHPMGQMHAHAHLGAIGFFIMMIVGVSYKLVPMFTISDVQQVGRARASIHLLNVGLGGVFVTVLLQHAAKPLFALVVAVALGLYGIEMRAILRARKRRPLDWGLRAFLAALCVLVPVAALGLLLSWPTLPLTDFTGRIENLYGLLALLGVVTLAILGMLYKIVPFLVWYAVYSPRIGRNKIPALAELYSGRLQRAGFMAYGTGLAAMGIATMLAHERLVFWSTAVWALGLALFAVNMGKILAHFRRPKLAPLDLLRVEKATI